MMDKLIVITLNNNALPELYNDRNINVAFNLEQYALNNSELN